MIHDHKITSQISLKTTCIYIDAQSVMFLFMDLSHLVFNEFTNFLVSEFLKFTIRTITIKLVTNPLTTIEDIVVIYSKRFTGASFQVPSRQSVHIISHPSNFQQFSKCKKLLNSINLNLSF